MCYVLVNIGKKHVIHERADLSQAEYTTRKPLSFIDVASDNCNHLHTEYACVGCGSTLYEATLRWIAVARSSLV